MPAYCINRRKVSHDLLEDEIIAIHFDTGAYYSLRNSAARLWQKLGEPASPDRLATFFSGEDEMVPIRLRDFLDGLVEDGLLIKEEADDCGPSGAGEWGEYSDPVLEKYTDMQDLLLADPIHDVKTAEGWPYLNTGS